MFSVSTVVFKDASDVVVVTELSRFPHPFWTISLGAIELVDVDRIPYFSHVEVPEKECVRSAPPSLHS